MSDKNFWDNYAKQAWDRVHKEQDARHQAQMDSMRGIKSGRATFTQDQNTAYDDELRRANRFKSNSYPGGGSSTPINWKPLLTLCKNIIFGFGKLASGTGKTIYTGGLHIKKHPKQYAIGTVIATVTGIIASIGYEAITYANSGAAINKGFIHDAYSQSASASVGGAGQYAENYGMNDAAEGMTHYIVADRAPAFESASTAPEAAFTFRQDDCVAVTGTSGGFNKVAFEDLNGDQRTVFVAQENVRPVPASGPGCRVK